MNHIELRTALVDYLEARGFIQQERVKNALLSVPRHKFVAGDPFEIYSDRALVIKSKQGKVISTISQPSIVAHMLEELSVDIGDKVLEIGTGLGYNAALLSDLTGQHGLVVTVEYDRELAKRAKNNLREYPQVRCIHADGRNGYAEFAPYNKIIATVTASDIYPEWQRQLSPAGGTILLPLQIVPGITLLLRLTKQGKDYTGRFGWQVNFVEMTGEGGPSEMNMPAGILDFVQKQNLNLKHKESLLFYCLVFNGGPLEALERWNKEHRPQPYEFKVESGTGALTIALPSLELRLSI